MSQQLGILHLQARLQGSLDRMSAGGACKVQVYDGTKPASLGAVTTQVKLAEFTMSNPIGTIVGTATNSSLTLPADATVLAGGTAAWARFVSGGGTAEMDTDVSVTGGGEAVTLSSLTLVAGGSVKMTSATFA